jgi:molybdopterin synthase catalytic subunit/molybdopterin converting factor small subunit
VIVRVLFFGVLKDVTGIREEAVSFPEGTSLAEVFAHYAQRFETLKSARPSILFARNREFCTPDVVLMQDDEVAFLPPVSGGSGILATTPGQGGSFSHVIEDPAGHVFALTRSRLESQIYAHQLQRGEDGAVVVFEGVVRNNTKGRATRFLEYECYEEMAVGQMARIGREIALEFQIGRIALIHRLGRLGIGEASVAVIVTAPHRRSAFEAALSGINRLKREVPIWKKEFFEDGAVWVEGEWDERLPGRITSS